MNKHNILNTFRMKKKYTFMALNDIYTTPSVDSVKKRQSINRECPVAVTAT